MGTPYGPLRMHSEKGASVTQVPTDPRTPLARRPVFWLVLAVAVWSVLAVVLGIAFTSGNGIDGVAATARPTSAAPASTDAATSPPTESPPPPAAEGIVAIPASCGEIYTRDWASELAPLVLNPEWTTSPDSGVHYGSRDQGAVELLATTTRLTCNWGHPSGGSGAGLTTNVARVDAAQSAAMQARFAAEGYACYAELEGTRCLTETEPGPDGQSGESHFFREDVWLATLWVNTGPYGYTHDIVAALFG